MTLIAVFSILLVSLVGGGVDVYAQTIDVAPVSSLTSTSFGSLVSAAEFDTITINSTPYAIVSTPSTDSSGIVIIDISNPESPTAVSALTGPSSGTSNEFRTPAGISTVTINSVPYAIVTASRGDGINIVNLSNPASPTVASSISDGSVFPTLNGAHDVATFEINSVPYAIITATADSGVQIINISDPTAPTHVSSATDGTNDANSNAFNELDGARNIALVTISSSTYAIVTATNDDGVQIIDISNPASPLAVSSIDDDSMDTNSVVFSELNGAEDITTVTIGSSIYALVASISDGGIQIINITNPAIPLATSSIDDGSSDGAGGTFNELAGAHGITTVTIGSATYALVAAQTDNGIQIINISDPSTPLAAFSVNDGTDSFDTLQGASSIDTFQIGSATYALVTASLDGGIQIISLSEPATVIPPQQKSITSTITIAQSNLPSIVFSDSSVNVGIDADGNGVLSFQSLIDDGTVVIENQGTNSVRFELDRTDAQWQSVNADIDGTIGTATFEIPTFTEGHTVLYNGTHLAFHFDDPTYRGTTPSLPLQASLHVRAADQYPSNPNVDIDIGVTTFTITDPAPPLCELTLGAQSLDLGTVIIGQITNNASIVVENTGIMTNNVKIGADHWCAGGCFTDGARQASQLSNTQTRFDIDVNTAYADRKEFTNFSYDGSGTRGTDRFPFLTPDLFSLIPGTNSTGTAYLQVEVELINVPGQVSNRFTGDISQVIVLVSDCN